MRRGRKVTLAVICLMMAWISWVTADSDFSGASDLRAGESEERAVGG